MTIRKAAARLHAWLGLAAGLLLIVLGLSGGLLVFGEALDTRLAPELLQAPLQDTRASRASRASLEDLMRAAEAARPGPAATHLRMPPRAGASLEVWLGGAEGLRVYLDPHSGRVLGARDPDASFVAQVRRLHVSLLVGAAGEWVVGALGLVLMTLSLSGLGLAWRRFRRPVGLVTGLKSRGRPFHLGVHRLLGLASLPILVLLGASGAAMAWHGPFQAALTALTGTSFQPPAVTPSSASGGPPLSLDSLHSLAGFALPGSQTRYVYLPSDPGGVVRFRQRFPDEDHPNGRSFVHLDSRTGEVLHVQDSRSAPAAVRLVNYLYPAHIGTWGGMPGRLLHLAVGFGLTWLCISGVLAWWPRTRR